MINDYVISRCDKFITAMNIDKTKQLVVYIGYPNTDSKHLIFPVSNPDTVKFVDLSSYEDILYDTNYGFPLPMIMGSPEMLLEKIKGVKYTNYLNQKVARNVDEISIDYSMPFVVASAKSSVVQQKSIVDIMLAENTQETGYITANVYAENRFGIIAYIHDVNTSDSVMLPTKHYKGLYTTCPSPSNSQLLVYSLGLRPKNNVGVIQTSDVNIIKFMSLCPTDIFETFDFNTKVHKTQYNDCENVDLPLDIIDQSEVNQEIFESVMNRFLSDVKITL